MTSDQTLYSPGMGSSGKAYLNEREVAERLNVSVKWLQKMRLSGDGIPFVKFGNSVRYSIARVGEFEQQAERRSTSEHHART